MRKKFIHILFLCYVSFICVTYVQAQEVTILEIPQADLDVRLDSRNDVLEAFLALAEVPVNEKDFFTDEQKELVERIHVWQDEVKNIDALLFDTPHLLAKKLFELFTTFVHIVIDDTKDGMYTQLPSFYISVVPVTEQVLDHLACQSCINRFEKEGLDAFCAGRSSGSYCVSCRNNLKLGVSVAVLLARCSLEYVIGLFEKECLQGDCYICVNKKINRYAIDLSIPYTMIGLEETTQYFYEKNGIEFYISLHAGPLRLRRACDFSDDSEVALSVGSDDIFELANVGIINLRWILLDSLLWTKKIDHFIDRVVKALASGELFDIDTYNAFKQQARDLTRFYKENHDIKEMEEELELLDEAYIALHRKTAFKKYGFYSYK